MSKMKKRDGGGFRHSPFLGVDTRIHSYGQAVVFKPAAHKTDNNGLKTPRFIRQIYFC